MDNAKKVLDQVWQKVDQTIMGQLSNRVYHQIWQKVEFKVHNQVWERIFAPSLIKLIEIYEEDKKSSSG